MNSKSKNYTIIDIERVNRCSLDLLTDVVTVFKQIQKPNVFTDKGSYSVHL